MSPSTVYAVLQQISDATKNPHRTVDDLLDHLSSAHGLLESVAALR